MKRKQISATSNSIENAINLHSNTLVRVESVCYVCTVLIKSAFNCNGRTIHLVAFDENQSSMSSMGMFCLERPCVWCNNCQHVLTCIKFMTTACCFSKLYFTFVCVGMYSPTPPYQYLFLLAIRHSASYNQLEMFVVFRVTRVRSMFE